MRKNRPSSCRFFHASHRTRTITIPPSSYLPDTRAPPKKRELTSLLGCPWKLVPVYFTYLGDVNNLLIQGGNNAFTKYQAHPSGNDIQIEMIQSH